MIDEALPVLEKAIAVAPDNPDAYYLMARCQMLKGDNAAAKENLQKAVKFGHPTAAETLKNIK
jgi:Tfp pilus assembly protein PilF